MPQTATSPLVTLLEQPKYEIIPMKNVEKSFGHIPQNAKVSVTVSPSKGIGTTLELAETLMDFVPADQITPHISARLVESEQQVKDILKRVKANGMNEIFIVGGDAKSPAGPYPSSLPLVKAFRELDSDIRLGITAYPEGHPNIDDHVLMDDLLQKAPYANFFSTQLCFGAEPIERWLKEVRAQGVTLPMQMGVAGVVDMVKLMKISTRIGVGDSIRYLSKHAGTVLKLIGGYKPDDLLTDLTDSFADEDANISAFHVYTFNQLEKTEHWRKAKLHDLGAAA